MNIKISSVFFFHIPVQYWKNVYIDYKEVATGIYGDCQTYPIKAATCLACMVSESYILKFQMNIILDFPMIL